MRAFITLEGTEGAGKSTVIRALAERIPELFKKRGLIPAPVVVTREPGGSPIAEAIRSVILSGPMSSLTELLLYEAARSEHIERVILPALAQGSIVLCDRFTDSSLAYQAAARGLDWKMVNRLNEIATRGTRPSLTLLLDLPVEVGLKRAQDPNRFEAEDLKFHQAVRKGFLKAKREDPQRWRVLQAERLDAQSLAQKATEYVERHLFSKKQKARSRRG